MFQCVANIECLEVLVLSLKITEVIPNSKLISFCSGVYSFLHQLGNIHHH